MTTRRRALPPYTDDDDAPREPVVPPERDAALATVDRCLLVTLAVLMLVTVTMLVWILVEVQRDAFCPVAPASVTHVTDMMIDQPSLKRRFE